MEKIRPNKLVAILLIVLPVWFLISGGFAIFLYINKEKAAEAMEQKRFSKDLSVEMISDDLRKVIGLIGERNLSKPKKLSAISSMIEGTLGPLNTGYAVEKIRGPIEFPFLKATLKSRQAGAAPIWVLTSYDSPIGSSGAEKNASGVIATMAAAQNLANAQPSHPVYFLFIPHANDDTAPLVETAAKIAKLIAQSPKPKYVLCIEAMGDSEQLLIASREAEAAADLPIHSLGEIKDAEGVYLADHTDLASMLFEIGLPAIRIATRPALAAKESDEEIPFAATLAASSAKLITLIERLAKTP